MYIFCWIESETQRTSVKRRGNLGSWGVLFLGYVDLFFFEYLSFEAYEYFTLDTCSRLKAPLESEQGEGEAGWLVV